MSPLNKKWNGFIYQPYAWPHTIKQISPAPEVYYRFLARFSSLEGKVIHLPWQYKSELECYGKLLTASEIHLAGINPLIFLKLMELHPETKRRVTYL